MAFTKKDYFEPGAASNFNSGRGDNKSQSFSASSTYTIDRVILKLWSASSNATLYYVRLYAADGSGFPTGGVLATFGSFTILSLQGSATEETFESDSYGVTSGNDYCIVCEADSDPNATWRWFTTSTNDYATGSASDKAHGFSWIARAYDRWFQVYEESIVPPTKADTPSPANDATGVDFSAFGLSWNDGGGADTFDVWIGPSGSLVKVSSAQAGTTYTSQLSECATEAKTYWRIDSTNTDGTTTGDTWNFDPRPVAATTPAPADSATDITLDETPLGWEDGGNADTYEIYYRAQGDSWVLVGVSQAGITWIIPFGSIDYAITYEWRIDATNQFGLTTGSTWSFGAISYDQIQISFRLISGGSGSGPYDSPPGVQGTDWEYTGLNFITAVRRLVAAAADTFWYEDI